MNDWEKGLISRLRILELNRNHILLLQIRLIQAGMSLSVLDDEAFTLTIKIIEDEIKKIKGDLAVERFLLR